MHPFSRRTGAWALSLGHGKAERMKSTFIALALAGLMASSGLAQTVTPDAQPLPSGTIGLPPEQREAAIEAGAAAARDLPLNGASDRRVHGEMGVEIGTGGERAIYGTTVVPIGQNGTAAVSFETGRSRRWRWQERAQPWQAGMPAAAGPDGE
jgi:hypothetical protein